MRCSRAEEFESYVDEPTTLDAVRALHHPPEVVVEVTKGDKEGGSGGGACGHSPICILLLPVIIEDLAFPVHYQNASVKTAGKLSYEAVFYHHGQFFRATARDDKVAREIQFLALNALERNVVVEVGRAPLDAQGKPGEFTRTRVQSQVDLLTPYTKLLSDPNTPARALALLEVVRVLGDDAIPLLKARLGDPKEPAEGKEEFFRQMCYPGPSPFEHPDRARELMNAMAAGHPSAPAALAALQCCERSARPRNAALKVSMAEARPLFEAILRALGEVGTTQQFLEQAVALYVWADSELLADEAGIAETRAAIQRELQACRSAARRGFLEALFDLPVADEDGRAMAQDPELAVAVQYRLNSDLDADYALVLLTLRSLAAKDAGSALATLHGRTAPPTQAELELLRDLYTKDLNAQARAYLLGRLAKSNATERQATARWLSERMPPSSAPPSSAPPSSAPPSSAPPSSNKEEGYLPGRPSDGDVVRHAALTALGSHAGEVTLLRYVARYELCPAASATGSEAAPVASASAAAEQRAASCGFEAVTPISDPSEVQSLADVARYALGLAGCETIDAARVQRALDSNAGALCP